MPSTVIAREAVVSFIIGTEGNLTSRAEKANREIAIEFRTTATADDVDIATVINDLTEYVSSLRGEDGVYLK